MALAFGTVAFAVDETTLTGQIGSAVRSGPGQMPVFGTMAARFNDDGVIRGR